MRLRVYNRAISSFVVNKRWVSNKSHKCLKRSYLLNLIFSETASKADVIAVLLNLSRNVNTNITFADNVPISRCKQRCCNLFLLANPLSLETSVNYLNPILIKNGVIIFINSWFILQTFWKIVIPVEPCVYGCWIRNPDNTKRIFLFLSKNVGPVPWVLVAVRINERPASINRLTV